MTVLDMREVSGGYSTKEDTIHEITLSVKEGEWLGLLGPNGAGKSTIIKALLDLLPVKRGEITLPGPEEYAFIPEHPIFFEDLTLWEHIDFMRAVTGLDEEETTERAEYLLKLFRLTKVRNHYPTAFSKGMQQKLMIILALTAKPKLYIIDEPFIGLDPKAMKDLLRELEAERERGACVLMSTHVLDTAEKICDRFVLVNYGTIIAEGTLDDIRRESGVDGSLLDCFDELMTEEEL
ncbi:ABC transporter ATP-binding protein [Bacillus daqingensis]|uniref:ABC transporter ATP-binding protein n=3 Tax=Bacillaceae TaxID=186817 RepID=A0A969TVI0_9BACI|nr:ABC transporter ATP-binding protein [Alkalicoccus luteus]